MLHDVRSNPPSSPVITISMFSSLIRGLWFFVLVFTLVSELVPLSLEFEAQFSTLAFLSYELAKLAAFLIFGFLTPIAWWRYNSLGIGVLFAIITTAVVEIGQAFIPGHRASAFELSVKLLLLFAGFVTALEIRKYQELNLGLINVRFSSRYWSNATL